MRGPYPLSPSSDHPDGYLNYFLIWISYFFILFLNFTILSYFWHRLHRTRKMSKTTIVATIGPASNTAETLLALHRAAISRYYLLFGTIQLGTLALLRPAALDVRGAVMAPIAVAIYFAVGNVLFARAGAPLSERAMTAFIGVYGAVVLAKTLVFA